MSAKNSIKKKNVSKTTFKSKTGSKTHKSELERLREQVRDLKSIVRNLKKQLSRVNKRNWRVEELEEIVEEALLNEHEDVGSARCESCHKGNIKVVDLGHRKLAICSDCGERKVSK